MNSSRAPVSRLGDSFSIVTPGQKASPSKYQARNKSVQATKVTAA